MVTILLSPFKSIGLAVIENAVNALIEEHPWARAKLNELTGKVIHLEADNIQQIVEVRVVGGFVELGNPGTTEPHAQLSAPLATWIGIIQSKGASLSGQGVAVKGDIFLFASLNDIWRNEEWAPELVLAPVVGHTGAHFAGKIGRTLLKGFKTHSATAKRQVGDFVGNEQKTLVTRRQFETFETANRNLRDDADRLQARVEMLSQRIANLSSS